MRCTSRRNSGRCPGPPPLVRSVGLDAVLGDRQRCRGRGAAALLAQSFADQCCPRCGTYRFTAAVASPSNTSPVAIGGALCDRPLGCVVSQQ
eukprot:9120044-Pyramimonas_sp.AAC.1